MTLHASETVPVATIADHNLHANTWIQIKNWLSYSDADGDAPVSFQFWDGGADANSGYFWTPGGPQNANTLINVDAADLDNVWLRAGGWGGATDTMWVRAFDGTGWGNWDQFILTTTNTQPVASIADSSQHANTWAQIKYTLSYIDVDGDAAVK